MQLNFLPPSDLRNLQAGALEALQAPTDQGSSQRILSSQPLVGPSRMEEKEEISAREKEASWDELVVAANAGWINRCRDGYRRSPPCKNHGPYDNHVATFSAIFFEFSLRYVEAARL